jgi:S1-C subfamily serine protease
MPNVILRTIVVLLTTLVATAATAQDLDPKRIWNANQRTVVKIKVSGTDASGQPSDVRTGSGVIVASNGTIVTALHVVGKDEEWFEPPGGGRQRKVEIIGLNEHGIAESLGEASVTPVPALDVAILYITATALPAATVAKQRPDDLAPIVAILWDPDSNQPQPHEAKLVPTDRGRYGDLLTAELAVIPGNSGAAVFDATGDLVGIITNQGTRQALIVPVDRFSASLPTSSAAPHPSVPPNDDIARAFPAAPSSIIDDEYRRGLLGFNFGSGSEDVDAIYKWNTLPIAAELGHNVKFVELSADKHLPSHFCAGKCVSADKDKMVLFFEKKELTRISLRFYRTERCQFPETWFSYFADTAGAQRHSWQDGWYFNAFGNDVALIGWRDSQLVIVDIMSLNSVSEHWQPTSIAPEDWIRFIRKNLHG